MEKFDNYNNEENNNQEMENAYMTEEKMKEGRRMFKFLILANLTIGIALYGILSSNNYPLGKKSDSSDAGGGIPTLALKDTTQKNSGTNQGEGPLPQGSNNDGETTFFRPNGNDSVMKTMEDPSK